MAKSLSKKDSNRTKGRLFTKVETRFILEMIKDTMDGHLLLDDNDLNIIKSIKNKLKSCNDR